MLQALLPVEWLQYTITCKDLAHNPLILCQLTHCNTTSSFPSITDVIHEQLNELAVSLKSPHSPICTHQSLYILKKTFARCFQSFVKNGVIHLLEDRINFIQLRMSQFCAHTQHKERALYDGIQVLKLQGMTKTKQCA